MSVFSTQKHVALVLLSFLWFQTCAYASTARDSLMSLHTENMTIREALINVAEEAGIFVYVFDDKNILGQSIRFEFVDTRPEDILKSILKGVDYAIIYNDPKIGLGYSVSSVDAPAGNTADRNAHRIVRKNEQVPVNTNLNATSTKKHQSNKHDKRRYYRTTNDDNRQDKGTTKINRTVYDASDNSIAANQNGDKENFGDQDTTKTESRINPVEVVDKISIIEGKIAYFEDRIESGESDEWYNFWISKRDEKYITHDRERVEKLQNELQKLKR